MTVQWVLYGLKFQHTALTDEFDHRMQTIQDRNVIKEPAQREELMRWIFGNITEKGITAEWASNFGSIKKATLNFAAKFWLAIVQHCLCPIMADNTRLRTVR